MYFGEYLGNQRDPHLQKLLEKQKNPSDTIDLDERFLIAPQIDYASIAHHPSELSSPQTGLVVPVFQEGDDPIDAINHMMSFLTSVVTSRQNHMSVGSSRPFTSGSGGTSGRYNTVQMVNCTKINQDNKQVNELLTAELERYRNQERVLKEQINNNQAYTSYENSQEIETLKHTLSEHLKEKESLTQKITLLKNDFQKKESRNIDRELALEKQKKESRNIDRELALEKQVKKLNNIVFKRNQSAQTVHMLTKPQVFYNHSTRQALGFQNPCYLKKAQQLKSKLYDGCVIEKSEAIVVPDTEETLLLAEESHSKMIEKQKIHKFEVPKELPKVSMVNSCLKKLKFHLASFDMVVKERTTATAITEGTWGFKHTKACFCDAIIPFVKRLKELFTSFDQCLIDEVTEVQNVFTQMELAVEQHCEEKSKVQTKMENVLQENDRLLTQALTACARCVTTETELKTKFFNNECYDMLLQKYHTLEKHCITLEVNNQLNTELFQRDTWSSQEKKLNSLNGDVKDRDVKRNIEDMETLNIELDHKVTKLATENDHLKQTYKQLYDSIKSSRVRSKEQCDDLIKKVNIKSAKVSDLNARLQEKVLVITALKEQLDKFKGKVVITEAVSLNLIDPKLLKVDVTPIVLKLRKNRTTHIDYIRHTQGEAATLRKIVESERPLSPLNTSLDYTYNTKNNRIRQAQKKAKKNKVEDYLRTVKSSLNKASVVDSKANSSVLNSVSNVNSNLKCASSNGCLLFDNHDICVGAYKYFVNARKKSKSVKTPVIRKIWKTTGKVFKTIGHIWKPTGWTFTLVGHLFPLTRIATPTIVPPREPIPIVNKTDKPVVTLVYSRKPKSKNVSNKMEPNTSWGSSSSNVPSSLSACRLSK
nr:hypothetical protein [Tanacetum cinerariifolium]